MSQLNEIRHQVQGAVQNQVSGARSRLKRELSLVQQASQWSQELSRQGEDLLRQRGQRPRRQEGTPARWERQREPAAQDGYQRRSPVQPVAVPSTYRRQIVWRVVRIAGLAALVLAGLWLLQQSGLLAF